MAVRTGKQFVDGLRDGREVWYGGRRIDDVTTFPPFAAAVRSMAMLYDLQHSIEHRDVLTVEAPELGGRIARAFEMPRTPVQLRLKRQAYSVWAEASCGMLGRSPDFMNVMLTALAAKQSFFTELAPERGEAVVAYQRHVARHDLFLTHALLDPQLDKGRLRHQQRDPGTPLRVVDRTRDGLIVHGIKRIATAAPYADEILVWPFPPTFQPGEDAYANVFAIPMATRGLKTICRPSFVPDRATVDHPLSARFDEMDATVVFDHVLVPWDRVFLHENIALLNRMYRDTRMRELTAHQTNARLEVKLGFLYAILVRLAEAMGVDKRPEIVELLGEAAVRVEVIRNTTRAAEEQAQVDADNGILYPDLYALQVGRALGPVYYPELLAMLKRLGGGGLVQLPVSMAEFDSPIAGDLGRSLSGAAISGRDKARLLKLVWDLVGTEFGARHELYEMNYAGERSALVAGIQREYGRRAYYVDYLDRFLQSY